jgi:hypothetical protein
MAVRYQLTCIRGFPIPAFRNAWWGSVYGIGSRTQFLRAGSLLRRGLPRLELGLPGASARSVSIIETHYLPDTFAQQNESRDQHPQSSAIPCDYKRYGNDQKCQPKGDLSDASLKGGLSSSAQVAPPAWPVRLGQLASHGLRHQAKIRAAKAAKLGFIQILRRTFWAIHTIRSSMPLRKNNHC